ncbi:MAG: alanine racemase, partial [Marinirhabdus sp.]
MSRTQHTQLEINLNALGHNYRHISSKLKEGTKVMAVVKAFGYGSAAVAVAHALAPMGVSYFAVAYAGEGIALRDAKIKTPILVLHPQGVNFEKIINRCLEPNLYSEKSLRAFIACAESKGQTGYPVHLKFNTGLNRLGFSLRDIPKIVETLLRTKAVKVKSVLSHLAESEDAAEAEFTNLQLSRFKIISEKITEGLGHRPWFHTLNTSGILNFPQAH